MNVICVFIIAAIVAGAAAGEVVFKNDDGHQSARQEDSSRSSSNNNNNNNNNSTRTGKNLLTWLSSFADSETDPYLARSNSACLEGDLSECFKAKALSSLDDFFTGESYVLNDNARFIRMPDEQLRRLTQEPYEFSDLPRTEEPEWDQFVKFITRKVERFLKSTSVEVQFADDVTENGRYAPRFIDEIATELDAIEDKKAGLFTKKKVKKLLIPLLIILKLFKLKLLLFLPLILGLASFKKFLGFLAIVIPGIIGFYKLCKPDLHHNYGNFGHSSYYNRPPHQFVSGASHYDFRSTEHPSAYQYLQESEDSIYPYSASQSQQAPSSVAFRDDPHRLAYKGYQQST